MFAEDEIKAVLRSIGARRSEVIVYLFLHKSRGPISFRDIVAGTSLSEKTVRTAIRSLMQHGFVLRHGKGRATRYSAVSPQKVFLAFGKKIEERVNEIFTRLRSRSK